MDEAIAAYWAGFDDGRVHHDQCDLDEDCNCEALFEKERLEQVG